MKKTLPIILTIIAVVLIAGLFWARSYLQENATPGWAPQTTDPTPLPLQPAPPPVSYTLVTLTTDTPPKELAALVGPANIATVLKLNRIDGEFLLKGSTLVIPSTYDWNALSPFPTTLTVLTDTPKLLIFSQRVQAFGVYEHGTLVRWGPISSGKQSTKTPNGLYFTNWKSEWIRSTENYDWILKWNFNLDNIRGIGMHQYELPGFPASHSCIRMTEDDAKWLYTWADQWIVSSDGATVVAHGTPVIVYGDYDFTKSAPWKALAVDPTATKLSVDELEQIITPALPELRP